MDAGDDEPVFISAEDVVEEYAIDETAPVESDDDEELPDRDRDGETPDKSGGEPAAPDDSSEAIFDGHSDSIYCIAVNPARPTQLLTGGGDDRGFLWSIEAGSTSGTSAEGTKAHITSVQELGGHADSVIAAGFSPDGTLAATGGFDGRVSVWDSTTGALKATLEGPEDIEWLCWHNRGNIVLAGSGDSTVWMWMASNGTCMQVFAGHEGKVTCGMFTSSGKAVVTGSVDCSVRVWAPKSGECRHAFAGHECHEAPITCLSANPDPEQPHVVLSGSEDGTAKLLHLQGKRVLATFTHSGGEPGSSGGGGGGDVEVYSVETVGLADSHPWAATGGLDGLLKTWDVTTARERQVCKHPAGVTKLQWHPLAPLIFTSCADGIVRLWDARSGAVARQYTGHTDMVLDFVLCADVIPEVAPAAPGAAANSAAAAAPLAMPQWLVSVSDDHTARVFDVGPLP